MHLPHPSIWLTRELILFLGPVASNNTDRSNPFDPSPIICYYVSAALNWKFLPRVKVISNSFGIAANVTWEAMPRERNAYACSWVESISSFHSCLKLAMIFGMNQPRFSLRFCCFLKRRRSVLVVRCCRSCYLPKKAWNLNVFLFFFRPKLNGKDRQFDSLFFHDEVNVAVLSWRSHVMVRESKIYEFQVNGLTWRSFQYPWRLNGATTWFVGDHVGKVTGGFGQVHRGTLSWALSGCLGYDWRRFTRLTRRSTRKDPNEQTWDACVRSLEKSSEFSEAGEHLAIRDAVDDGGHSHFARSPARAPQIKLVENIDFAVWTWNSSAQALAWSHSSIFRRNHHHHFVSFSVVCQTIGSKSLPFAVFGASAFLIHEYLNYSKSLN